MKQLLLTILCAFCCLAAAAQSSFYDFQVEGVCYKILSNTSTSKTCQIVGKYEEGRSNYDDIFTEPVDLNIPTVVVDRSTTGKVYTVVSVGNQAFKKATKLHGINLPASVTSIGDEAFYASGVTSISMPGVRSIGARAFNIFQSVTYREWPVNLETIGTDAFYNSVTGNIHFYNLRTIAPSSTPGTQFALHGEIYCYTATPPTATGVKFERWTPIHVPKGCLAAYKAADGWKDVEYLSDDIIVEANDYFNVGLMFTIISPTEAAIAGITNDKATTVEVPSKVTIAGHEYTVTKVAESAFKDKRNIKSVVLPSTITHIGDMAFQGCTSLSSFSFPKNLQVIGKYSFEYTELPDAILPEGLKEIKNGAFLYCNCITKVVVPSSVTLLAGDAFAYGSKLKSAEIKAPLTSLYTGMFHGCNALEEVILPRTITYIDSDVFRSTSLSSFVVPEGVKTIDLRAFKDCKKLTSIELPASLTNLTSQVFDGCTALETVICNATKLPTTAADAFGSTPADFDVFVPAAAYDNYKADAFWGPHVNANISSSPVTITYSGGKLKFEARPDITGPICYTIELLDDTVQGTTTSGQLTLSGAPADSKPLQLLVTAYCDAAGYGPNTKSKLIIECPSDYTGDLDHNGVINSNDIVVLTNKVLGK